MGFEQFLFYLMAGVALISSLMMISVNNPVKAALWLVLAFIATGGVWVLSQAEFLGIVLILVYAGAVMVLFLFVIMMLDINLVKLREGFIRYLPIGVLAAIAIFAMMYMVVGPGHFSLEKTGEAMKYPADYSNSTEIGKQLYTVHAYAFVLAAVLLLVGIVAAIALTIRRRAPEDAKYQVIDSQVKVRAEDRFEMVKMDPVVEPRVTLAEEEENK